MQLDQLLDRCQRFEERAAALYRSYAASAGDDQSFHALWSELASEEDEHAHAIARARRRLEATAGWQTRLDGWEEALTEVERCLGTAEGLAAKAPGDRQLSAALELEMTELDALRHVLLATCHAHEENVSAMHAERLADAAIRLSDERQVRLQAALLRARAYLEHR